MTWRPVTKNSPARDHQLAHELDTDPILSFMETHPWVLGNGDGIAIVAPLTPHWLNPSSKAAKWGHTASPDVPRGSVMCLAACAIKLEYRRQGHAQELIRILRTKYGRTLLVSAAILDGMGGLSDGSSRT